MSEWIGRVGENINRDVTLKGYIHRDKWQDRQKIIILEDEQGNIITIRTYGKFKLGGKWRVDGKVKRHHCFNGQKQTHLSAWGLMLRK